MKSLQVSIGGRMIPLKIEEDEEKGVLEVVADLNEKLSELQVLYNNKDLQDCLAMTLLTYAFESYKRKKQSVDTKPDANLQEKLNHMGDLISKIAEQKS